MESAARHQAAWCWVSRHAQRSCNLDSNDRGSSHIRDYRNGRDLTRSAARRKVIDLFGLNRRRGPGHYPSAYQWVVERVKPERDQNNRESLP